MMDVSSPVFATLGPAGSNHEFVTRSYIEFHRLKAARIELVDTFDEALSHMISGRVHHTIQVAVHPDTRGLVAKAYFRHRIFIIDAFVSPSRPMGIITRRDVEKPTTLALQPATLSYTNIDRWATIIPEKSISSVADGLLTGRYDSGLTSLDLAEHHPDLFVVDEVIGTIDDAWIVYGKERTSNGRILAWPDSPGVRQFHRACPTSSDK